MSNFEKYLKNGEEVGVSILTIILLIVAIPIWVPGLIITGGFILLLAGFGLVLDKLGYKSGI